MTTPTDMVSSPEDTRCPACGKVLQFGEFPFCGGKNAHGFPRQGALAMIDDQLDGGPRRFETLGHDEPFIESKSQLRREMEIRGLEFFNRKDTSYHVTRRKRRDEEYADTGTNREY